MTGYLMNETRSLMKLTILFAVFDRYVKISPIAWHLKTDPKEMLSLVIVLFCQMYSLPFG